jgi:hypothetical protein
MDKIGIGVTCHGRNEYLKTWIEKMEPLLPPNCKLVIVDDASPVPIEGATFRFEKNVGVAAAKNKCLELLDDCEHIFLFDDDTHSIADNWWEPYINAGQPHLMYIFKDFATGKKLNDTVEIYRDDKIVAYSHARGCMMYFHSSVLQYVGGMDPVFGKWGYDHPDLSNRIYNAGLTTFRYMDVANSAGLFYSADEHQEGFSTCTGMERRAQIMRNKPIYESRLNSAEYVPYREGAERKGRNKAGDANMVLTCYFTSVADPQGREWHYDFYPVLKLAESVLQGHRPTGDKFIVFHDCVKKNDVIVDDRSLPYRKPSINPYFQRWVTYREWLIEHQSELDYVWCVDATDVEMLRDPFPHMEKGKLYVGDEPDTLRSVWLNKHHNHPKLKGFFARNYGLPLLNAGLVGGDVDIMLEYTARMIDMYQEGEHDAKLKRSPNAGLTDMGAHNYVCYTYFKDRVIHGKQINTEFKKYEADNGISWFKHK